MEYRDTAIQLVIAIIILTGILIKLIWNIISGLYRDLTAGRKESELTIFHKIFYALLSVGGVAILFVVGIAILGGGMFVSIFGFIFFIIIGKLFFS